MWRVIVRTYLNEDEGGNASESGGDGWGAAGGDPSDSRSRLRTNALEGSDENENDERGDAAPCVADGGLPEASLRAAEHIRGIFTDEMRRRAEGDDARALTRGEREYLRVLEDPVTEADLQRQIAADGDGLIWTYGSHPSTMRMREIIGYPDYGRETCFACNFTAREGVADDNNYLHLVTQQYRRLRSVRDEAALAIQVYVFFEKYVRRPHNARVRERRRRAREEGKGAAAIAAAGTLLPEWTPAMIHEHYNGHTCESTSTLERNIRRVDALLGFLFDRGLYRYNGRDAREVRVDDRRIATVERLMRLLVSLHTAEPAKMAFARNEGPDVAVRPEPDLGDPGAGAGRWHNTNTNSLMFALSGSAGGGGGVPGTGRRRRVGGRR
jgi:hypothetical protein